MSMYNAIKRFPGELLFNPEIKNSERLKKYRWYIIAGMGGSHLAADLLKTWKSNIPLFIHKNYGLPDVPDEILENCLIIISSYSGNTEESLNVYELAKEKGIPLAAISIGGKLLEYAISDGIPYIQIPDTGIYPRAALGFSIRSMLAMMKETEALEKLGSISVSLESRELEEKGKQLAENLYGYIPMMYSSAKNGSIPYNWKIKINETTKIPAFCNIFPELNHNEMTGFDIIPTTKTLIDRFCFVFINDESDHPKIRARMVATKKLFEDRGLSVIEMELVGDDEFQKIFTSLMIADWTSLYLSEKYGTEPEAIPMIEEFKKTIA